MAVSSILLSKPLLFLAALIPIFYTLDQYVHLGFVFDPVVLQQIAQKNIATHGNDTVAMMRSITEDLKVEYGDAIHDWTEDDWFWNNAGGAMVTFPIFSSRLIHTN